ncbi:hypothetical protein N9L26_01895 [Candidatus Pacebacteria bacterium]|nr:hypothetical protein [Candidatus Paceibacterota bacterium]
MANTPGGSFIPKRTTGTVAPKRKGQRIYILNYIAYALFFGTLVSVVGIFILDRQATGQLERHIVQLDEARQSVNESQIQSVRELDQRIKIAGSVLNTHMAPSRIFEALEEVIVASIQLTSFGYERDTGGGALLSFAGLTDTFDVLLFQREVVKQSALLSQADVVSVEYGEGGGTQINGTNRANSSTPASPATASGEASVTFTFEDTDAVSQLGYQPRFDLAAPSEIFEDSSDILGDEAIVPETAADEEVTNIQP